MKASSLDYDDIYTIVETIIIHKDEEDNLTKTGTEEMKEKLEDLNSETATNKMEFLTKIYKLVSDLGSITSIKIGINILEGSRSKGIEKEDDRLNKVIDRLIGELNTQLNNAEDNEEINEHIDVIINEGVDIISDFLVSPTEKIEKEFADKTKANGIENNIEIIENNIEIIDGTKDMSEKFESLDIIYDEYKKIKEKFGIKNRTFDKLDSKIQKEKDAIIAEADAEAKAAAKADADAAANKLKREKADADRKLQKEKDEEEFR